MENLNTAIRKEGALRGVLFGVILLVVNTLLIYASAYWITSPLVYFLVSFIFSYVVQIGLAVFLSGNLRKKIGGYWTLKQAATGIFFILFVTYLISSSLRWLYFQFVDPVTMHKANVAAVDIRRRALQLASRPAKDIEKTISDMKVAIAKSEHATVTGTIQDLLVSVILLFAVAAILGALYKRERPVQRV